jgi:hypothetical protein
VIERERENTVYGLPLNMGVDAERARKRGARRDS